MTPTASILKRPFRLLVALCTLGAAAVMGTGCKQTSPLQEARPAGPAPSFRAQIAPVLAQSCAKERGCHGSDPVDWVEMDLREGTAYAALVGAPADNRGNAVRVKPFSPAESFLLDKLNGNLHSREGKQMPLDPRTNRFAPEMLPPEFVTKVLEPWIAAGAPNN